MNAPALSIVITTLNNADTLNRLFDSIEGLAAEVLILDSGSTDHTLAIATARGARIAHQPFLGYGPQKQHAVNLASHDWVLLLDADEALTPALVREIAAELTAPRWRAYRIPRREWLFWRFQHATSKHNRHLRLFDRRVARLSDDPIHAAPVADGPVGDLQQVFLHYGERDIATKIDKINGYSSGMAERRAARSSMVGLCFRLLFYPPLVFLKQYLWKRQFANGWAGYINAVSMAFYTFLKDAKAFERKRRR